MLRKYLLAFIIAVSLITVNISCSNVEEVEKVEFPPYFKVDKTELSFMAEGEKKSLSLVTTVPWEAVSSVDWLKVTPISGEYNSTITVTATANESVASGRTATVRLVPESGEEITISVSQDKVETKIALDINELSLSPFGDEKTVNVLSNTTWSVLSSKSWLTVTPLQGGDNQVLTLVADKNDTGGVRSAIVTITSSDGEEKAEITVSQHEAVLLFPGADFEDWDLFLKNNHISESEKSLQSQSPMGTGVNGGRAISIKGSIREGNPAILKFKVPENYSLEGKSRLVFYIKGTCTKDRALSINWYKPNGINFYTFYPSNIFTEDLLLSVQYPGTSPDDNGGNNYRGEINTEGKWVKVSMIISDLPFDSSTTEGGDLLSFRAGGVHATYPVADYDILIDNISLE